MLFTLIKNELIKIFRRGKTWIVFILFVALVGVTMYGSFYEENQAKKNITYNIESLKQQNQDNEGKIKNLESSTDAKSQESLVMLKKEQENIKDTLQSLESELSEKVDVEEIKASREKEIATLEENLKGNMDDRSKSFAEQHLEVLKYLQANNIYEAATYKTNPYKFMTMLFAILATMLLIAGIAVFMSDIVSGECTPPTLKFLLIQPISRGKVLFSKFIAVTTTVLTMIMGMELIGFLLMGIARGFNLAKYPVLMGVKYEMKYNAQSASSHPAMISGSGVMGTNGELLLKSLLLQVLFIITCCAFVFLISTLFKSSMITMAISVLSTIAVVIFFGSISFLKNKAHLLFFSYANTQNVLTGDIVDSYNNVNLTLTNSIIVMVITTVLTYAIAHFIFNKKDILI